jgi:hypothetical protein
LIAAARGYTRSFSMEPNETISPPRAGLFRGVLALVGLLAVTIFGCLGLAAVVALATPLDAWAALLLVGGGYLAVSLVITAAAGWLAVRNAAPADVPRKGSVARGMAGH